jgi:hypothetical protein
MKCDGCNNDVEKTIPNRINNRWYNLGKCCFTEFRKLTSFEKADEIKGERDKKFLKQFKL